MKLKEKGNHRKSKKFSISVLLYVIAAIVALLGVILLTDDIYIFKSTVNQYVMQGYIAEDVMKSLIPVQLLPQIIETLALYGGMTFALLGIGIANNKISKYLTNLNVVANDDVMDESLLTENIDELENKELTNEEKQDLEVEDMELISK